MRGMMHWLSKQKFDLSDTVDVYNVRANSAVPKGTSAAGGRDRHVASQISLSVYRTPSGIAMHQKANVVLDIR